MQVEITEEQAASYNALHDAALKLVRPNVLIDGEPQSGRPGWFMRRKLRRGISLFREALEIAPFMWQCWFWIGKALQRLGEHRAAWESFNEALSLDPDNPTIAKEAGNQALELGDFETGVSLVGAAIKANPTDPVLHYDLSIHLILLGRPEDALESLRTSARLQSHRMTRRLTTYVERIVAGSERCPRTLKELVRGA